MKRRCVRSYLWALSLALSQKFALSREQLALQFLNRFEGEFVNQGITENRDIHQSLDLAWNLLRIFPREQLNRIPQKVSLAISCAHDRRLIRFCRAGAG